MARKTTTPRPAKGATAAGGGSPGTNTTAAEKAEEQTVVSTDGAAGKPAAPEVPQPTSEAAVTEKAGNAPAGGHADDDAAEDLRRKAEAVAKAGDNVDDMVSARKRPAEAIVVTHIEVRSTRPRGRRRAGRSWGPAPVRVALADLTADEVESLQGDPLLQTEFIAAEAE